MVDLEVNTKWRKRHKSIHFASSHKQKDNNKCKNKKQPELPENRTVWKSNNQGVKEETFIQTGRRGGDGQPGQRGLVASQRLVDQVVPHLHADKLGGTIKEQDRPHNPGFQHSEKKPQNHWLKTCGGCSGRRNSQPHRRVHWRDPQGPRTYTKSPTWQSAPEGPNLLGGSRGSDCKQVALFPLWLLHHRQCHNIAKWVAPSWQIPKVPPLTT